ncbi:MAG: class I SAM-dependent methyltransferase [Candidatus Sulfotelmatobacter sp.]
MKASTKIDADFAAGEPPAFGEARTVSAAEGYEWWAPSYDHAPNPLLAREERYLSALLTGLHGKSALDLACGTGRWLEKLMEQGCESGVGIDYSSAMLRVAGEKPAIRGRLARADCDSLPLPSDCFDLAICSFAVGHIHDLGSVARELGRVTRAGADVFVTDLHSEAYALGWRVGFRWGDTAIQIEVRPRTADEIVRVFCLNGFQCKRYETLWLGEPERSSFERAGKSDSFVAACKLPAVLVCHFRRHGSPPAEN